jgi:uncharacterized membrane protein
MTEAATYRASRPVRDDNDVERALAGGVYALHLLSLFMFLAPAILGVVIAYVRGATRTRSRGAITASRSARSGW